MGICKPFTARTPVSLPNRPTTAAASPTACDPGKARYRLRDACFSRLLVQDGLHSVFVRSVTGGLVVNLLGSLMGAAPAAMADVPLQLKMQRELGYLGPAPTGKTPTFIFAEEIEGNPDNRVTLKRNAEIRRDGNLLRADTMVYDVADDTVKAFGNARIIKPGVVITGPSLQVKTTTSAGEIEKPRFYLENTGGVGEADKAQFNGVDKLKLFTARYTTCQADDIGKADWYVKASELDLDNTEGEGVAKQGEVRFKDVRLFKTDSLSFPLRDTRKSGFLPPTVSFTTRSGLTVSSPYYLDIAPNRDLTIIPRVYATRGLQLGGHFRYLEPSGGGELKFERLENDQLTNTTRYSLLGRGNHALGNGLVAGYNLAKASDDRYFVDFSRSLLGASQRTLPRDVFVSLLRENYNFTTRVTRFQTLQDPLTPIAVPYDRVPQLLLTSEKHDVGGLDIAMLSEVSRFVHPTQVNGNRLVVRPSISAPVITPAFSFTPRLSLHSVNYQLNDNTPIAAGNPRSVGSSIPILSLDGKLLFERDSNFRGTELTQTLEPRAFFLYVPNRDQSRQPLFDTGVADFNQQLLFSENRFSGFDRVGDARQLTLTATSRFLDREDGSERLRLFAGQRLNLSDQTVTIPGQTALRNSRSDFLLGAGGPINPKIYADALTQISSDTGQITRGNVTVRMRPGENQSVNVAYRYTRDALGQIDLSGQYPLGGRWYGVGRVNYSFRESRYIETIAGFEYDGGCWVTRVVTQSFTAATGTRTSTIFFQLELNGFSKIGSDPMKLLRRTVPGYSPLTNTGRINPQNDLDSFSDYQ